MNTPPDRNYAVFISYRHADNKEQGRQWATWLHHTLETYEIPPDLVGRINLRGEPVPGSLYPVFRDEEELPADADLSANIQRALRHSALLVVLCSPRAVESRFVADEIRCFKQLGKAGHILALMIDGEPNASDDPGKARIGTRPEHECLPEPLRYGAPRADGSIDWTMRTEPIAADVRPQNQPVQGWTTAAAYREEITHQGLAKPEINRLTAAYEKQLQLATMKIIAGAIGLPLGELTQRDKVHQLDQQKRRARALRFWLLLVSGLGLLTLVAGGLAHRNGAEANAQRIQVTTERDRQKSILHEASVKTHGAARQTFESSGEARSMLGELAEALQYDPQNSAALADAAFLMVQRPDATFHSLCAPILHTDAISSAFFSPDGSQAATTSKDTVRIWHTKTGTQAGLSMLANGEIAEARFSPNGKLIIATVPSYANEPAVVNIWNLQTGKKTTINVADNQPNETRNHLIGPELSPDGLRVIIGYGHIGQYWKLNATPIKELTVDHGSELRVVSLTPDGLSLITGGDDGFIRFWNAATGKLEDEYCCSHPVTKIICSKDGRRALAVTNSNELSVFKVVRTILDHSTLELIEGPTIRHNDEMRDAAFSPDGTRIVSVCRSVAAYQWDALTGSPIGKPMEHNKWVRTACYNYDGKRILTSSGTPGERGEIRLWDSWTGKQAGETIWQSDHVSHAEFSSNGKSILSVSEKELTIWPTPIRWDATVVLRQESPMALVKWSHTGRYLAMATETGMLSIWDTAKWTKLHHRRFGGKITCFNFSPDDKYYVGASGNSMAAFLVECANGQLATQPLQLKGGQLQLPVSAEFSPDGQKLLLAVGKGQQDDYFIVWNIADISSPTIAYKSETTNIESVQFNRNGERILRVGIDEIEFYDSQTYKSLWRTISSLGAIRATDLSSDYKSVLSAGQSKSVKVLDSLTGLKTFDELVMDDWVWDANFSQDGRWIAAADGTKVLRIWNASSGLPACPPLRGDIGRNHIEFSPRNDAIAAFGTTYSATSQRGFTMSNPAQIWHVQSGIPLGVALHSGIEVTALDVGLGITDLDFSPDGNRIATASPDGSARIWHVPYLKPINDARAWIEILAGFRPNDLKLPTEVKVNDYRKQKANDLSASNLPTSWQVMVEWLNAVPEKRTIAPGQSELFSQSLLREIDWLLNREAPEKQLNVTEEIYSRAPFDPMVQLALAHFSPNDDMKRLHARLALKFSDHDTSIRRLIETMAAKIGIDGLLAGLNVDAERAMILTPGTSEGKDPRVLAKMAEEQGKEAIARLNYRQAGEAFAHCVSLRAELLASEPSNSDLQMELASAHLDLAGVLKEDHQSQNALREIEKAQEILLNFKGSVSLTVSRRIVQTLCLQAMAIVDDTGDFAKSAQIAQTARKHASLLLKASPQSIDKQLYIDAVVIELGCAFRSNSKGYQESLLPLLKKAFEVAESLDDTKVRINYLDTLNQMKSMIAPNLEKTKPPQ